LRRHSILCGGGSPADAGHLHDVSAILRCPSQHRPRRDTCQDCDGYCGFDGVFDLCFHLGLLFLGRIIAATLDICDAALSRSRFILRFVRFICAQKSAMKSRSYARSTGNVAVKAARKVSIAAVLPYS
jgi:hypothetical protein